MLENVNTIHFENTNMSEFNSDLQYFFHRNPSNQLLWWHLSSTITGNKKSWWWNKLWKRRTITARDLKYLDGENFDSEHQTCNTAPEQVRGRRGAASFVTSRPTGPQTSKHLSLESLPHLRPLVCDQVEVAKASELFPFHHSIGVFVSRLHHRQQDRADSMSMYWNFIQSCHLGKVPRTGVSLWTRASTTFEGSPRCSSLLTSSLTFNSLFGTTTKNWRVRTHGSWNSDKFIRVSRSRRTNCNFLFSL